jgi:3-methyladenine DNA glycosylase AlkD
MTAKEILAQLKPLGGESYKKTLQRHGAKEPVLGVKIEELKKFQKRIKKDYQLALDLFDTGVYDAQYLAGLIADETKMTKKDLKSWLKKANSQVLCGNVVPGVAADGAHGWDLALEWIDAKNETTATAGWTTLSSVIAVTEDDDLDVAELKRLLARVVKTIHDSPNRVRYAMNNFVISLGCYVRELTGEAVKAAKKIGTVTVDMGDTACEVPSAPEYIEKVRKRGSLGKKRKTARC